MKMPVTSALMQGDTAARPDQSPGWHPPLRGHREGMALTRQLCSEWAGRPETVQKNQTQELSRHPYWKKKVS